jgi:hypothetical protein
VDEQYNEHKQREDEIKAKQRATIEDNKHFNQARTSFMVDEQYNEHKQREDDIKRKQAVTKEENTKFNLAEAIFS